MCTYTTHDRQQYISTWRMLHQRSTATHGPPTCPKTNVHMFVHDCNHMGLSTQIMQCEITINLFKLQPHNQYWSSHCICKRAKPNCIIPLFWAGLAGVRETLGVSQIPGHCS